MSSLYLASAARMVEMNASRLQKLLASAQRGGWDGGRTAGGGGAVRKPPPKSAKSLERGRAMSELEARLAAEHAAEHAKAKRLGGRSQSASTLSRIAAMPPSAHTFTQLLAGHRPEVPPL